MVLGFLYNDCSQFDIFKTPIKHCNTYEKSSPESNDFHTLRPHTNINSIKIVKKIQRQYIKHILNIFIGSGKIKTIVSTYSVNQKVGLIIFGFLYNITKLSSGGNVRMSDTTPYSYLCKSNTDTSQGII